MKDELIIGGAGTAMAVLGTATPTTPVVSPHSLVFNTMED